jgi:hypothetical protein
VNRRPIVFVHGYSADGRAFETWRRILVAQGHDPDDLLVCGYVSLVHEVTLKDLAEAFERALAALPRLAGGGPFDAIVHSTGMLVIRAWLAADPGHRRRLAHLIGLAPATFGSPLAHKGRGWLGAMVKGNREQGPDFFAVGDEILDGLELASRFTWDLAHDDLIGAEPRYGAGPGTPYPFVLCGVEPYRGLASVAHEDGTDGAVRLAGAAMNSRKITLDLTLDADGGREQERTITADWSTPDAPLVAIAGVNHGTILSAPTAALVEGVISALDVASPQAYAAWHEAAAERSARALARAGLGTWQQLVFRVVDERGDGVRDYFIDFIQRPTGARKWRHLDGVDMHVHPYARDPSLRCFHVNLDSFTLPAGTTLGVRLIASSGTHRLDYRGYSSDGIAMLAGIESPAETRAWTAAIDLSALTRISFFYPFTTTLVEIRVDRTVPAGPGVRDVLWFAADGRP